jgi:hypothetical protein
MKLMGWDTITYPTPAQRAKGVPKPPTVIPSWFAIVDANGIVDAIDIVLWADAVEDEEEIHDNRYEQFLKNVVNLRRRMDKEALLKTNPRAEQPEETVWEKDWHNPDPRWPYPHWQKNGGWWTCRTGPGASEPERECKLCTPKRPTEPAPQHTKKTAAEWYRETMSEIQKAMSSEMEMDIKLVKARMEQERREAAMAPPRPHRA